MNRQFPRSLKGKVIDGHSHAGVSIKAYALAEYPYAQTIEGLYYQQLAGGVDVNIVFPYTADLHFDPAQLRRGRMVPAKTPLSPSPYAAENRLLAREIYDFCPELAARFLPFACIDPERDIRKQLTELRRLVRDYPIYGFKVNPVGCQSPVAALLDRGRPLLDFAEERDLPVLFHVTTEPGEDYSQAADVFRIVEQRPGLRFCLAHALLFHRAFLERADALPNVWVDTAALKIQVECMRPAIRRAGHAGGFLDADYSDHRTVMRALAARFPHTIIWGTDSPAYSWICRRKQGRNVHREFRLKGTYAGEVAALRALKPSLRARIGGANALDFLFGTDRRQP